MDLLLNYDYIYELAHSCDKHMYTNLAHKTSEYTSEKFSFFSLLFASKVKRKQTSLSEYKVICYCFFSFLFFSLCFNLLREPKWQRYAKCAE